MRAAPKRYFPLKHSTAPAATIGAYAKAITFEVCPAGIRTIFKEQKAKAIAPKTACQTLARSTINKIYIPNIIKKIILIGVGKTFINCPPMVEPMLFGYLP